MSRIFAPETTEGQEWVRPLDARSLDLLQGLDGTPRAASWSPLRVEMLHEDEGSKLRRVDLPWVGGHALAFRDSAMGVARELLASVGEFLELRPVGEPDPVWLFNATCVVDALDESRSDLVRFPSTGRIMKVTRYAFMESNINGIRAFRVPQLRTIFVNEVVADGFRDAGMDGTSFKQVWSG